MMQIISSCWQIQSSEVGRAQSKKWPGMEGALMMYDGEEWSSG